MAQVHGLHVCLYLIWLKNQDFKYFDDDPHEGRLGKPMARSGVPHAAKSGRYSLVHFVLKTKMEMPPTFSRVRFFSAFLYTNGNIVTV
jgi:hypothetical protein